MRNAFHRLDAAVPDAITAGLYVLAWTVPKLLGVGQVRLLLTAVLVEFLVMHASAFYGFGIRRRGERPAKRAAILGAITAVYLVPIVLAAVTLKSFSPVISFLWLFTCRFAFLWRHPATVEDEMRRMKLLWMVSLASYFLGTIAVTRLPLPALGITPDFVAALSLSGHPNPKAQPPWLALAFGIFYFAVQAATKFVLAGRESAPPPPQAKRAVV